MYKTYTIILLFLCAICAIPSQSEPSDIALGTISKNRYHNSFFNMTLTIPENWHILSKKHKEELLKKQRKIASSNKSIKNSLKKSEKRTKYLLIIYRFPPEFPTRYNISFMCIAENLKGKHQVKTGKDYLKYIKRLYRHMKAQSKTKLFTEDMLKIGNKIFDTLSLKIKFKNFSVTQCFYVTLTKDHAISFIFTYTNKKEKHIQEQIINSVTFN